MYAGGSSDMWSIVPVLTFKWIVQVSHLKRTEKGRNAAALAVDCKTEQERICAASSDLSAMQSGSRPVVCDTVYLTTVSVFEVDFRSS